MPILFFLLIIFLFQFPASAQTPMPSQKEVQAQMQEAKKEAEKLATELEQQIAEARLKKEDPATIQEKENQLATIRKMFGLIARADTMMVQRPKNLPESKTVLPKYISPIVQIHLKGPLVAPAKEQAKDSMLWYRGRRLNDSMLVTTQRTVVLYSRNRNMLVIQPDPGKDTFCLNIAKNLAKGGQWTNDYVNHIAATKNSFFQYPQTIYTVDEFKFIEETYNNIIGNTINLPGPGNQSSFSNSSTNNGPSDNVDIEFIDPNDQLRALHQDLMNYMKNPPPLDFTEPRFHYITCSECNSAYDRRHLLRNWQIEFLKYEKGLLGKIAAVRALMMNEDITDAGSGIPSLTRDLDNALVMAFDRWDQKVSRLEEMNKVDYIGNGMFYTHVVIENLLLLQVNKKNYSGVVNDSYTARINNLLIKNQQAIIDYFENGMRNHLFNDVMESWIISGFDRHRRIFKGSGEPLKTLVEKIRKFNRFSVTINMEFEIQQNGTDGIPVIDAEGKLSNRGKVYVSIGRLFDCRWQLYLTNTDYTKDDENSFRIPMEVVRGTKYIYLQNPVRTVTSHYSGPKEMLMVFPYSSLNLCVFHHAMDSIIIDALRYETEDLSGYKPSVNEYSVDLQQYANKIFLSAEKVKKTSQEIVTETYQMMTAAYTHAKVDKPTDFQKLDQMQVEFKMKGIQQQHQQNLVRLSQFPNALIRLNAFQGKGPTLLHATTGMTNTELEGIYNLKKGRAVITVVHDPEP